MSAPADVCLLLEDTYPFVRSGPSAWVHALIGGLPELNFSLVFLGTRRADFAGAHYSLPENVVHLEVHYLDEAYLGIAPRRMRARSKQSASVRPFHQYLRVAAGAERCPRERLPALFASVEALLTTLERPGGSGAVEFLSNPETWEQIREAHLTRDEHAPFADYFSTLRALHGPLFQLARLSDKVPAARAFHATSTGYAGFLGALLSSRRRRPLVLSEQSLYARERRIALHHADGLDGSSRALWIRHFEALGRLSYRAADPIVSVYAGDRARQQRAGAARDRTRIIGQGIHASRSADARVAREPGVPPVIGLAGRVTPSNDVKTFIRAMRQVVDALPDAEGWILGSADDDPSYAAECAALARSLGLDRELRFLGHPDLREVLPQLGLLALTSSSEALPLALLEALAAGVPCIATDLGACSEVLEGTDDNDRALGLAGRVVPFGDPDALAQAAIVLSSDARVWYACQAAGIERVARSYSLHSMLQAYRGVYAGALEA